MGAAVGMQPGIAETLALEGGGHDTGGLGFRGNLVMAPRFGNRIVITACKGLNRELIS
jgi:hypothetical protein